MSLDTVLQIGKALRSSKEGLKRFKYLKECPKDTEEKSIFRLNIPVKENFSFDWENVGIVPENQIQELCYLTFKTSDNDSSPKKFFFGDICYTRQTKIDKKRTLQKADFGNFTLEKGKGRNAFLNGIDVSEEIKRELLEKEVQKQLESVVSAEDRNAVSKIILSKYFKRGNEVKIPKQLYGYRDLIDEVISKLSSVEKNSVLFKFQNSFRHDLERFNNLLLYAPVINEMILSGRKVDGPLNSRQQLKDEYFNYLLKSHFGKIKKLLKENETEESLTVETKDKISNYSDFTVFIHFDFNDKHWFQFKESFELLKEKLYSEVIETMEFGLVPKKSIYRTLCSGDDKNDIQFPGFDPDKKFKSFAFVDISEFEDLLYTSDFLDQPTYKIYGTNIGLYVLPKGSHLGYDDYIEFLSKQNESRLSLGKNNDEETVFTPLLNVVSERITAFDFILSNTGGNTICDLIELSGIEKSTLKATMQRITQIGHQIKERYGYDQQPKIEWSFLNILGIPQSDQKTGKIVFKPSPKYQSHILKVLPRIYSQTYYRDEILPPSFIDKVEFSTRNGDQKDTPWYFKKLKYYLEFLLNIQNNPYSSYMEITSSKNYQVGLLLGSLSKGLKNKINSFEKNYVGNLSRRISTLSDCIKFKNEIEQKNIMHDLAGYTRNISNELSVALKECKQSDYDKEQVAFGFFESYFRYETKKGFIEKLEKLLTDFASSEDENAILIQKINEILETNQK